LHNAYSALQELNEHGINVVQHIQGPKSFNDACKTLERWVLERQIIHDGNPVLAWAVCNATVRRDANDNIMPNKAGTREGKIDPLVALCMAITGSLTTEKRPDWWDTSPPFYFGERGRTGYDYSPGADNGDPNEVGSPAWERRRERAYYDQY
jgi:phage terminase large subunit-like protein